MDGQTPQGEILNCDPAAHLSASGATLSRVLKQPSYKVSRAVHLVPVGVYSKTHEKRDRGTIDRTTKAQTRLFASADPSRDSLSKK